MSLLNPGAPELLRLCRLSPGLFSMVGAGLVGATACKVPEPPPFVVRVHIESDPGVPLADIPVTLDSKEEGKSDAQGILDIKLARPDGTSLQLQVKCPSDRRPIESLSLGVKRTADDKPVEYTFLCRPIYRTIIVAVRAEGGPNLPIYHLNDRVALTDSAGAAHFSLTVRPGDSVPIRFDTSAFDKMLPQSPTRTFLVKDSDALELVSAKFETAKAPTPRYTGRGRPSREIILKR